MRRASLLSYVLVQEELIRLAHEFGIGGKRIGRPICGVRADQERGGGVRGRERAHAAGERVGVAAELGSGDNALRREFAKAVPVVELRTLRQVAAGCGKCRARLTMGFQPFGVSARTLCMICRAFVYNHPCRFDRHALTRH